MLPMSDENEDWSIEIPSAAEAFRAMGGVVATGAGFLTSVLGGALSPGLLALGQQAGNRAIPVQLPPVADLMSLYYRGVFSLSSLKEYFLMHGVAVEGSQDFPQHAPLWRALIEANRPRISAAQAADGYYKGQINLNQVRQYYREQGLTDPGFFQALEWGRPQPPVSLITKWWRYGLLRDGEYDNFLALNGISTFQFRNMVRGDFEPYNPGDVMQLINRGLLQPDEAAKHLRASGYTQDSQVQNLLKMRFMLPGPSDLIRFAVRDVWAEEVVQRFGYDAEFPREFGFWAQKQGLDYPLEDAVPGGAQFGDVPWSKAYWRAHWEIPSPGQCYTFLHRFRPLPNDPTRSVVPGVRPFTTRDMELVLKTADYPAYFREWLIASSYNPLTRVDVRRAVEVGKLTEVQAVGRLQDIGYSKADAEFLASYYTTLLEKGRNGKSVTKIQKTVRDGYKLGTFAREEAAVMLYRLMFLGTDTLTRFDQLEKDSQVAEALANQSVSLELEAIDAESSRDRVKSVIAAVKRAALTGDLDAVRVRQVLTSSGVALPRVEQMIVAWDVESKTRLKRLTAPKLVKLYVEGLMPRTEVERRLKNLNYPPDDRNWLLSEADLAIAEKRQKQFTEAVKETAKTAKGKEDAVAKAMKELKKARKTLVGQGSTAQLKRWFVADLIGEDDIRVRLVANDWTSGDIDRFIEEVRSARDKQSAKEAKEAGQNAA